MEVESILLFFVGLFAAVSGSVVGLGGGFIIVPILALFQDLEVATIVGTSMAVLFFTSLSSTYRYSKQKRIDYKSGLMFAAAMFPGSILGAWITNYITDKLFFITFGIFMMLVSLSLIFKPSKQIELPFPNTITRTFADSFGKEHVFSYNQWVGIVISFFAGILSSMLGIGGGSVMVPTMVLLLSFPAHIAAATSMFSILFASIVGTASHFAYNHIDWSIVVWLAAGSLIGGQLGAKISSKLPEKIILRALATCLMVVAVRLMFKG
ncbi:sulfite exporter TauE/SafE family protein [Bacillus marasmi]|uniref:sulfite exporter TauE/SafE family protein n=1 Tax=Bacillus marasmi TaxID=1926279 RepID=UPI0011CA3700|nr:sulfite exporter TauE/SafE family protein [Bacillus marasmi]